MQQRCTNCGAPLQSGSIVCTTCGTSVSSGASGSYGAGAYDPTVRAGTPPNSSYGSPSYGAPPPSPGYGAQSYGAPPPPNYGAPSPPNYGAPPPPNFGTPPPSPGFGSQPYGAPPPPNFGAPPPVYPVMQPPQRSRSGLVYRLGGISVAIIILIIVGVVLAGVLGKGSQNFTQQVTTGKHITAVSTGTGFDENTGAVEGEKSTFSAGDTVWIVYTVTNPDQGATVVLKIYNDGTYKESSDPVDLDPVTNTYANSIESVSAGNRKVELYYNGTLEASITFNVTA